MRVLLDPETGELVEVLPGDVVGTEPYDFAGYKRATMAATREKRGVLKALDDAIVERAEAEGDYARKKSAAVETAKREHGSTVAPDIAKGKDDVAAALERREKARDMVRAWQERSRLCSEDRASLHRLGEWSREADPDGWRNGGGA